MAEDWAIQVNFKIGGQYGDLINVRAADGMELQQLLSELAEASTVITETAKAVSAVRVVSEVLGGQVVPQTVSYTQQQLAPAQDQQGPPGVAPKYCDHGQMVFKSGTSGKGNAYALHECPIKDPNCPTKWEPKRR